jgi:hypothetical protein
VDFFRVILIINCLLAVSCQLEPYAPPPVPVIVESAEVEVRFFAGRPEAIATVKGTLTSSAAMLVDPKQSRVGNTLFIEVLEQTPRGATLLPALGTTPPFRTRIPIELLGTEGPGTYILDTNGIQTTFEIPAIQATVSTGEETPAQYNSRIRLVDEFIPIKEAGITPSGFIEPAAPLPKPKD